MMNHSFGLKFVHVPYKGIGAALTAVMAGEVQLSGVPVPVALPQVKAGKAKAYAITSKNRFSGAPDIPTVAEAGFAGFDAVTWFAMFAPAQAEHAMNSHQIRESRTPRRLAHSGRPWIAVLRSSQAPLVCQHQPGA